MNKIVEKAYELQCEEYKGYLPELEVGEIAEINDIWNGEGDIPEKSYSIKVTDNGYDGESNIPVWINYVFEVVEIKKNPLDTKIRILNIELI